MAIRVPSTSRAATTRRGSSVTHFLRVLRYSRAYLRYLYPAIVCIIVVAVTYSVNIVALLPVVEAITGSDGLPTWIHETVVERRLGLELDSKGRIVAARHEPAASAAVEPGQNLVGLNGERLKRAALLRRLAYWRDDAAVALDLMRLGSDVVRTVHIRPEPVPLQYRLARRAAQWLPQGRTPSARLNTLAMIVVAVLVIAMVGAVCRFAGEYLIALVAGRTVIAIRRRMYRKVLRLPVSYFATRGISDTISRFVQDSQDIYRGLNFVFAKTVREPLKALFSFVAALIIDWRITLITVVAAPFAAYLIRRMGKMIRKANKRMLEGYGRMLGALEGSLTGIRVVKGFGMENHERRNLYAVDQQILKQQLKIARIEALASPIFETIGRIVASLAILYFANQMFHEQMRFSKFATLAGLMAAMFDPIRKMSNMYNRIQRANAAAERVFEILEAPEEETDARKKTALPPLEKSIEFRDVRFTYPGADAPAIDGVNLTIRHGERIAFVGPNGSGKTTLLSMLLRFFEPDSGAILFDGRDVRQHTLASLRGQMSLITQDTVIFAGTIGNNIAYGNDELLRRLVLHQRHPERHATDTSRQQRIVEAARAAFADEFIRQKPKGYDTYVGEHGATLSGGQKQRIAIARAFLRNAPIFIFDEATSQVDAESEHKIHDALGRLLAGRTAFIIAHRFSTILQADRIAVMEAGRIVDVGRHDELVQRCDVYRSLFGGRGAADADKAEASESLGA
ncbi:MAG: ABC transporter ATP-binding protein [Phycisphaerae bacterium]